MPKEAYTQPRKEPYRIPEEDIPTQLVERAQQHVDGGGVEIAAEGVGGVRGAARQRRVVFLPQVATVSKE